MIKDGDALNWQHRRQLMEVGRWRADALIALLPRLALNGYTPEVLAAAREITSPWGNGRVLVALLPYLEQPLQEEVCNEAVSKGQAADMPHRGCLEVLVKVLPYLPAARKSLILDKTLSVAQQMAQDPLIGFELEEFATRLAEHDYCQEALLIVPMIKEINGRERVRVNVLKYWVKRLVAEGALPEALATIATVDYALWRAWLIAAILPLVPENLRPEIVQSGVKAAQAAPNLLMAMTPLLPYLPQTQRAPILETMIAAVLAGDSDLFRTQELCAIFTSLTDPGEKEKIFALAINSARSITVPVWRAGELLRLAPYASPVVIPEILETAEQVDDEMRKADILAALLPYVSAALREQIVPQLISALNVDIPTALLWPKISDYLAESVRMEWGVKLLEHIAEAPGLWSQALALKHLAPHLPEALLRRAFYIAKNMGSEQ